jgi:DNA-binding LacI/PurR family transcriptional regulator
MAPATIRDVARRANVGVGTVSRVLNGSPSVRRETRDKVLVAIEDLDFHPSPIARRLSLRRTLNIAVIIPFFTRPVFVDRLRGIERALAESEYDLVLYNVETVERRDECLRIIPRRERVDGLMIISLSPSDEDAERILSAQVPAVLVDASHPRLNRVLIDDCLGGHMATEHLIELGHNKIGFVGDLLDNPLGFTSSRDRYLGYCRALEKAGITPRPDYHRKGEHSQLAARAMAKELLSILDKPTAIFAASDTQAIGVLWAARDLGLSVPNDLSLIGYDDIELAEYLHLTTVRQPSYTLGLESAELLFKLINEPDSSPRELLLETELIVRGTTSVAV